jgi:hypothetical protein
MLARSLRHNLQIMPSKRVTPVKAISYAAAVFLAAVAASPAKAAAIVYDNLAAPVGGSDSISGAAPLDSFSTGAQGGNLVGVTLLLSATPTDGGSITVNLYSDSSQAPGGLITSLATILDSALGSSPADFAVTLAVQPTLLAGTRYWIGLTATTSSGAWSWSTDNSGTDVNTELHQDFGNIFCNSAFAGCSHVVSPEPYIMQVAVDTTIPVPEPATAALIGVGMLGLGILRRRQVRAPQ